MRYLITTTDGENPFLTNYYTHENCFNMKAGMVVYDLVSQTFTNDGNQWQTIEVDHL